MSRTGTLFEGYKGLANAYDELFTHSGEIHPNITQLAQSFDNLSKKEYRSYRRIADATFKRSGITFTVYSNEEGQEKIFPFDLIPRIIPNKEWKTLEKGLCQRLIALNAFLNDIYGEQRIIKEKKIPEALVKSSPGYLEQLRGITPPGGIYIHVSGIDIVRDANGKFLVLEDNVRTPSGVSYVLENRSIMKRLFPDIFSHTPIKSVEQYPIKLREAMNSIAPHLEGNAQAVLLTPGSFNSAYFEHCFLARKMGCPLAQGCDLFVKDKKVYMKTTTGPQLIEIIYRRIDDEYLDPNFFNPKSLLGVPGLMEAYATGNVVLANAVGNGIADDKAIYPYVPEMIRFYLSEEPILDQVETFHCSDKKDVQHVLSNLSNMVVKPVNASGGYGMLVGPTASQQELENFKHILLSNPREYIAQPLVELSTCPTYNEKNVVPRRIDLRPFVVMGKSQWVLPGGLTRVALNEGSYVVNSSQGGGSKDTWVLGDSL